MTCIVIVNVDKQESNYIHSLIQLSIQNWILFNGIIPFSVKIFLILARQIESKRCPDSLTVYDPTQIDDFGKINMIISDKTGTITQII